MSDRNSVIELCKKLQEQTFIQVALSFQEMDAFQGKIVKLSRCCSLVMRDLDELYDKRHFNFDMTPSLMVLYPNPEYTIPLGVCMYVNRLPVAYAIGDINDVGKAFEIHFIETSNFYGNTGLKVWVRYLLEVLATLQVVLAKHAEINIDKVCFINPVPNTIEPLVEMGFDIQNEYGKSNVAAILRLNISDKHAETN